MVDRVNAPVNQNKPDDEAEKEHNEKMAALADEQATHISSKDSRDPEGDRSLEQQASEGDDNQVPTRPDGVPEKFWDAEKGEINTDALIKAQADGEAEINRLRSGKQDEPAGDDNAEGGEKNLSGEQTNVVSDASAEWAEKGELSDETYQKLEGVGLGRDMVDEYIRGQQAIVGQLTSAAYGEFDGTKETYDAATQWAAENLSDEEITALDAQLTSNNPVIVQQGAKALAEKYQANADIDPNVTLQGGGNNAVSGSYFKSGAEMQTAMADPRYKSDPAFRKEVEQKIARADKAGVNLFG